MRTLKIENRSFKNTLEMRAFCKNKYDQMRLICAWNFNILQYDSVQQLKPREVK